MEANMVNRLKRYSNYFAAVFFLQAAVILTGWVFDIRDYLIVIPHLSPMNPITATLFILLYFSLRLIKGNNAGWKRVAGKGFALFIIIISVARYSDFRFGTNLQWDTILLHQRVLRVIPDALYSRMSPVISLCFIVGSTCLFGLDYESKKKHMPAQYGALLIALTGFTGLLTFIYSFNAFSGSLKYVIMALPTAIGAVLIGLSLLFVHPDKGLMRKFTSNLAGGVMARRVIPFVIILPVIFGVVRLYLNWSQINTNEAWLTVGVLAVILSLLVFTSYVTRLLNRRDKKVIEADDALRRVNAELEENVRIRTKELRSLLEHVQKSREEERKYIAREIHDDLGQRLTAVKMQASMLIKKLQEGNANTEYLIAELREQHEEIINSIKSVKQIATDLRPEILDHLGILEAVKWQAQQFENSTGVRCEVEHREENLDLRPLLASTVYRIVQESLTNVARHSRASHVMISIESASEQLLLRIKDDGRGIKESELQDGKSFGLIGMRERIHILKGKLSITGEPNKGTTVSAEIPLINL